MNMVSRIPKQIPKAGVTRMKTIFKVVALFLGIGAAPLNAGAGQTATLNGASIDEHGIICLDGEAPSIIGGDAGSNVLPSQCGCGGC